MQWMRGKGIRFAPIYGRQAFKIDGKFKFWGGLTVESVGGGPGLVEGLTKAATKAGIAVAYETRALCPDQRRRRHQGRAHPPQGQDRRGGRQVRGAGGRRLPGQRRVAHPLSGPRLGARQGARHALQHRRRHPHGARHRRAADRQLVGLARRGLGPQRAGVRRPGGRRQLPEAQLSVLDHAECQRRAVRRRGRRLPQLHLRQVRPRHPQPADAVRLAAVRQQGAAPAARRIPHQARHQGAGRHARGAGGQARRREPREGARDHQGVTTPR